MSDVTKDMVIYLRKDRPYSQHLATAIGGYDVTTKLPLTIDECLQYCNEELRCLAVTYHPASSTCHGKFTLSVWTSTTDADYDSYSMLGTNPGPCPAGTRFRDLCIERTVSYGLSHTTAKSYCRYIGGHLLRPFDYKKWSVTNLAGYWGGYWRIDLDSVGHDGSWKTETDKIYPEMWQWEMAWSGVNGPVGDPNCLYGVLKGADRVRNETYYGGKISCDGGNYLTEALCEYRKFLTS